MSLKELCCLPCSLWLSVAWNFLQRKKSTWFASCKLNLLERIHLQVASLMQFSFEHSIKTLPGLKGSRKSSSEWEIWRFSPSLQDAILEHKIARGICLLPRKHRARGAGVTGNDVNGTEMHRWFREIWRTAKGMKCSSQMNTQVPFYLGIVSEDGWPVSVL